MENIQNILNLIRTGEQQEEAVDLIGEYLEDLFRRNKEIVQMSFKSGFTKDFANKIAENLNIMGISENQQESEKFLNQLLEEVKKMKKIKLTISFIPQDQLIEKLSFWAKNNFSEKVIFELTVDPKIVGGAIVISPEGEYKDYSLLRKIEKYFSLAETTAVI